MGGHTLALTRETILHGAKYDNIKLERSSKTHSNWQKGKKCFVLGIAKNEFGP